MTSSQNNKSPLSLYVHLPWCERRCPYCDFSITTDPVGKNDLTLAKAIIKDINNSSPLINGRNFSTIYFGGGTPSLSSIEAIEMILNCVKSHYSNKDIEITFEMNPTDVTKEKVNGLSSIGVNRFSLGVQSFHDAELKALGRNHDKSSALNAINILAERNITVDLMYGIELQTIQSFEETLNQFIESRVNHLSLYQLTIEPNTIYYKKALKLPMEEEIEAMENSAKTLLKKSGYHQYEVSSWSKAGFESKHNLNYWMFGDYLGVGPGAHSKITSKDKISRFRKIKPLNAYIKNQKITDNNILLGDDLDIDLAMNLLRIKEGITPNELQIELPKSFLKKYLKGVSNGLLKKDKIGTTKKGYQYLNETINLFF